MLHEENLEGKNIRQNSDDQDDHEQDHDGRQLVLPQKVRIVARSPGAVRVHGRQNRPPLSQLHDDLVIEERCDDNCDFEDNHEAEPDDQRREAHACTAHDRDEPRCDAALGGPCLGQPDLGLEREHDSDVTLQRHH